MQLRARQLQQLHAAAANHTLLRAVTPACLPACHAPRAQLLEGSAEIFGAELALGSKTHVTGAALAVFSWHGCKLLVEGAADFV